MYILIAGATGGIGRAIAHRLKQTIPDVTLIGTCRQLPASATLPDTGAKSADINHWLVVDLTDDASVATLAQTLSDQFGYINHVINAVGLLHTADQQPEKTVQKIEPDFFLQNMQVNVLPSLLLARYCAPLLKQASRLTAGEGVQTGKASTPMNALTGNGTQVFATVSAKVGSIEDNRLGGWYSYRSSKAALNMGLKTLSIEWQRTLPSACVVALHPGTTDTALSAPFQARVPAEQLFSPAKTAHYLVDVVASLTPKDTGSFIAFDGERLPW